MAVDDNRRLLILYGGAVIVSPGLLPTFSERPAMVMPATAMPGMAVPQAATPPR